MQQFDYRQKLETVFGPELAEFLKAIGRAVADSEEPSGLYLVGGAVRDLVSGTRSADIDLMYEGDGPQLASRLRDRWDELFPELSARDLKPAKPVTFPKYRTAKLPFRVAVFPGITSIDFSSARAEKYPAPGQPPVLTPGGFQQDMQRRDFSINALAIDLLPGRFGTLIDLVGGVDDLNNKLIRVLHDRSFIDDPARMIRACRFAARFDFKIEPKTAGLFKAALEAGAIETLPRFRLFDEFRKALDEPLADSVVDCLNEQGLIKRIEPLLKIESQDLDLLRRARAIWEAGPADIADYSGQTKEREPIEYWMVALGVLYRNVIPVDYKARLAAMGLSPAQISRLSLVRHLTLERWLNLGPQKQG